MSEVWTHVTDSKGPDTLAGRKKNPRSRPSQGGKAGKPTESTTDTVVPETVEELASDIIQDAEVIEDAAESVDKADEFFEDEAAETLESVSSDEDVRDVTVDESDVTAKVEEKPQTPEPAPIAAVAPVVTAQQKPSAMPMVLGGVVAACIGAGGLYFADMQGWLGHTNDTSAIEQQLKAQSDEIAALQAALTAATEKTATVEAALPDLSPLQTAVDALEATAGTLGTTDTETAAALAALTASLSETRDNLTTTSTRLGELEVQPIPKAELPKEVVAAFETQLAEILATIEGRFTEMQTAQAAVVTGIQTDFDTRVTGIQAAIDARLAEIDTAQSTALAMEEAANAAAEAAKANTAAARIVAALDTGEAFADSLDIVAAVEGISVPAALSDVAADGAASVADLQASFPAAARIALSVSASAAVEDGSMSPLGSFFATQLGARSLEPREGNSPDAILSRAEAAIGLGDIDATMAELETLPDAGQAAFADWLASATALRDAKIAATDVVAQLNNK